MARVFHNCTEKDIVRFAYREHLLRFTTPLEEVQRAVGPLFSAYKAAREQGSDFNPELLDVPEPKVALHRLSRVGSEIEETQEVAESLLPVPRVYILQSCVLLYTVEMTTVDGYIASTGARKPPSLGDAPLLSLRSKLYSPPLKRGRTTRLSFLPEPASVPPLQTVPHTGEPPRAVQETGPKEDWRPYHYASDSLRRERDDCACRLW